MPRLATNNIFYLMQIFLFATRNVFLLQIFLQTNKKKIYMQTIIFATNDSCAVIIFLVCYKYLFLLQQIIFFVCWNSGHNKDTISFTDRHSFHK